MAYVSNSESNFREKDTIIICIFGNTINRIVFREVDVTCLHSRFPNVPKRYQVILLLLVSFLLGGYVATNLNVIIVDITSSRKRISCDNGAETIRKEFEWSSTEVGLLLGISSVGTIFASVPGFIVHKVGGATFIGIGKLGEAFISLTTPLVVDIHVYLFIASRFILGLFEGLTYIGLMDVLAHWALPNERVRMSTFVHLAFSLGIVINYPVSGTIIHYFGWRNLYYVSGMVVFIWSIIWFTFVSNDPSVDKFISQKEKLYLSEQINYFSKDKVQIPYKQILTSMPVLILLHEFFISFFIVSFMGLLPLYVKDVYREVDISTLGIISGIPELSAFVTKPLFAYFADRLRSKRSNEYSIGKVHKLFLFWGQSFTLLFFFVSAICDKAVFCLISLTFARIAFSLSTISYDVIIIDVAGQYAGFVQSMAQAAKSMPMFLNPILIGWFIPNHTQLEWNIYFFFISFLILWGIIVFLVFGSGELQPWAQVQRPSNERVDNVRQ